MNSIRLVPIFLAACICAVSPVAAQAPASEASTHAPLEQLSSHSALGDLLENPAASEILKRELPQLLSNPAFQQAKSVSLRQLANYVPGMLSTDKLDAIDRLLKAAPGTRVASRAHPVMSPRADAFAFEDMPLWPGAAPGALGTSKNDIPSLNVFQPDATVASSGAAVIIAPGGGYQFLSTIYEGRQLGDWFAARGITAFILNYRLASAGYKFPVPLNDAQRALRWVRANAATYKINPKKVGMIGFSAGGHLTAMTETSGETADPRSSDPVDRESSRPDFAILVYPGIVSDRPGWTPNALLPSGARPDVIKALAPAENVSARTPPTFIVHATGDEAIPASDSTIFFNALRASGVSAELHVFDGGRHGFGLGLTEPGASAWSGLLETWLRNRGLMIQRGPGTAH